MEINELKALIEELAKVSQKTESKIIADLAEIAKTKYGTYIEGHEREIIELVQNKLIRGFYRMPNYSYVTSRPNYKTKFDFDDLEMKYLSQAANELGDLGFLEGNETYTQLTEKGILKAKQLRGELQ